jgi:DNA primase
MYDFISLLNDYNIEYKLETEDYIQINCPFHDNGSRGFKGGLNKEKGFYHCWVCSGKTTEDVFAELLQVSNHKAKEILNQYLAESVLVNKLNRKKSSIHNIELPGEQIENKGMAYLYLSKRGFSPADIIRYYSPLWGGITGDWPFRIIIPIYYNKQLVSFQARSIFSKAKCDEMHILRYKNNPVEKSIINPKHILYNLDNCIDKKVVVVEGVFDCWRLGPKNVCATMGTSLSEEQIILLAERFDEITFLFDNEKEAQERAEQYADKLSLFGKDAWIFNPEFEHDPGAYNKIEEYFVRKELEL